MGHLTFVSKRLSAVGNKRISQFFDSARAPRSRVIALVDSTWVFLLLSFLYRGTVANCLLQNMYISINGFTHEKKFSTVALTCLEGGGFDPL